VSGEQMLTVGRGLSVRREQSSCGLDQVAYMPMKAIGLADTGAPKGRSVVR